MSCHCSAPFEVDASFASLAPPEECVEKECTRKRYYYFHLMNDDDFVKLGKSPSWMQIDKGYEIKIFDSLNEGSLSCFACLFKVNCCSLLFRAYIRGGIE